MMSKCGSCGGLGLFTLKEVSPTSSRYKFLFIQCTLCGVPVGVVNYFIDHETIMDIHKNLKTLEGKVNDIDHSLRNIVNTLNNQR